MFKAKHQADLYAKDLSADEVLVVLGAAKI